MNKNKKIIIIVIVVIFICIIGSMGTILGINYSKNKATYVNKLGDKFTEEQMSTITANNESIKSLVAQLKQDEERNLGTLTVQAQKDIKAYIPSIESDSAKNIIELQEQLLSNLQQDIASN